VSGVRFSDFDIPFVNFLLLYSALIFSMLYHPFQILNTQFCGTGHEKERRRKRQMGGRLGKEGEYVEKAKEKIEFKEPETEINKRGREAKEEAEMG
jgi:hypothetical protein